ncbi:phosphoglycerate dehydrogenase-like enzyme [Paenibacillus taihuensis]|uniref:Phosphoglycerate dehydrogenase-like enzyme n=1 Tax=Paenibacillus taihuensis TaxID=1156355 RepID=A0A3D9QV41_9BACL|nr:NAD(P)-dependent oxidoreductase [Paenibacillus taihuensis]REE67967.1 phosphoglycerate dehydrogenase-like enzyme [Paenibacillus taihuensis]
MRTVIVVNPAFEIVWPWTADRFHSLFAAQGAVEFTRLERGESRTLEQLIEEPGSVTRLVSLMAPVTADGMREFSSLKEAVIITQPYDHTIPEDLQQVLTEAGVKLYRHKSEGYWGQSVSEFGLALTLCGLRRIPQTHHEIITSLQEWDYEPAGDNPKRRGHQFGDNPDFTSGTVEGKRIRIVGAGNIASRYASFVHMLGADVAAWDPFAAEPSFHRTGARKEWHLDRLVQDAEIFAPMVPLTPQTQGLITAELIYALPKGCLVVLVTRADVCDMKAIRERVLKDEISLAADVFDIEPLPLADELLGRHNVVHTPHNAGRTIQSNERWAEQLFQQFLPA